MNDEKVGLALERLYSELSSQRAKSGWEKKLKCAGYMKYRDDYEGTSVERVKTYDSTALECLDTYVDGFIGYLMPQDDDWFKLMPRRGVNESARDKEYGGFAPLMDEDGTMRLMDALTDTALMEFSTSCLYEPIKTMYKDSEVFGNGYIYVDDGGNGEVLYREIDPQECVVAEDAKRNVDVFLRKFRMAPIDIVREYKSARVEKCWERVRKNSSSETADVEVYEAILPKDYLYDSDSGEPIGVNGSDNRKVVHLVWIPLEREIVLEGAFNEMPVYTYSPYKDTDRTPYGKGIVNLYIEEIALLNDMKNMKQILFKRNVNPPMLVHQSLQGQYSSKAGAVVYTADVSSQTATPLFKEGASNNYQAILNDIAEEQAHIRTLMNADLFRTLMGSTDSRKTAYEVSELKNEALTLLSMKVGNFARRVIEPIVKRTLKIKIRSGVISLPDGIRASDMCAYIDTCTVMLNSVFVRKLQGYLRYQGLVSGFNFIGACAQLEQTQAYQILESDSVIRSGLYASGFPAYGIKEKGKLEKEREEQARMQQQMMQAQMQESQSKSVANLGKGLNSIANSGISEEELSGALNGK